MTLHLVVKVWEDARERSFNTLVFSLNRSPTLIFQKTRRGAQNHQRGPKLN